MKSFQIYLQTILQKQMDLQKEIKARNSALYDNDDIKLDQAIRERLHIEHLEVEMELLEEKIIQQADRGFFGYTEPGGLTRFFYGYNHSPSTPTARDQSRK